MRSRARRYRPDRERDSGLQDEVLSIRVHNKITKGGRNISFGALVAVGDGKGKVGLGYGKARGVPMAIEKASKEAKGNMARVPLIGDTVCHEQEGRHKSARVLIKPAAPGTGVKAGGPVRAIMNVLGVHNVLTKSLGNNNPLNLAKATMDALGRMRSAEQVQKLRGESLAMKHPQIAVGGGQGEQPASPGGAASGVAAAQESKAEGAGGTPEAAAEQSQ
jgi:small subunit ribosomal protein S5